MAEPGGSTEAPAMATTSGPPAASAPTRKAPAKSTYSMDPILYLYTSLTAGSSHIITATSRLETILKANKIPFKGVDLATDDKAKMLWGRRAGKDASGRARKLPGLVQMGLVVGDIVDVEEWNEYGELRQNVKIVPLDAEGNALPPKKKKATAGTTKTKTVAPAFSSTDSKENIPPAGPVTSPGGSLVNAMSDLPRVELLKELLSPPTLRQQRSFNSFTDVMGGRGSTAAFNDPMEATQMPTNLEGMICPPPRTTTPRMMDAGSHKDSVAVSRAAPSTTTTSTKELDREMGKVMAGIGGIAAEVAQKAKELRKANLVRKAGPAATPSMGGARAATTVGISGSDGLEITGPLGAEATLQSPTSTAWREQTGNVNLTRLGGVIVADMVMQSPTTTAWSQSLQA